MGTKNGSIVDEEQLKTLLHLKKMKKSKEVQLHYPTGRKNITSAKQTKDWDIKRSQEQMKETSLRGAAENILVVDGHYYFITRISQQSNTVVSIITRRYLLFLRWIAHGFTACTLHSLINLLAEECCDSKSDTSSLLSS